MTINEKNSNNFRLYSNIYEYRFCFLQAIFMTMDLFVLSLPNLFLGITFLGI